LGYIAGGIEMKTVAELIAELQQFEPEDEVCGCKCGEELLLRRKGQGIGEIKLREASFY